MGLSAEDKAEMLALLKAARDEERKDPEYQNSLKALVTGLVDAKVKVDPKKGKAKADPVVEDDDVDLDVETEDEPTAKPKKKPAKDAPVDEMRAYAVRFKALERQLAEEKRIAAEQRAQAAADARTNQIRDALAKKGVPADRLHPALAVVQSSGLVKVREDGSMFTNAKDKYGVDVEADIETGISQWLAGDTGKLFVPPVQSNGNGGGIQKGAAPRTKDGGFDWNSASALKNIGSRLSEIG